MSRHDPWAARDELKRRIVDRLASIGGGLVTATPELIADRVMTLFTDVTDDWDRVDVTTLGESGESFIDNRWLIARVSAQSFAWSRPVDRTIPAATRAEGTDG